MRCSWYRIVDILGLVTLVYLPILVKASENASFLEVVVELVQPVDFSPVIPVFVLSNDTIPASNELQLLLLQSPATLYPSGTSQEQPRNDSVLDDCHFMSFEEWKTENYRIKQHTTIIPFQPVY